MRASPQLAHLDAQPIEGAWPAAVQVSGANRATCYTVATVAQGTTAEHGELLALPSGRLTA